MLIAEKSKRRKGTQMCKGKGCSWLVALLPVVFLGGCGGGGDGGDGAVIPPPVTPAALEPVNLRSATNFAVLAGSTVANTGPTFIYGELGVSPGGAPPAVTGFPPGIVSGTIHAADSDATQAMIDLNRAYSEVSGLSTEPGTVSGDLGGLTLNPGLYSAGSDLAISSGDLTLDAKGNPNGVFIFQMASFHTLTIAADRQVILIGSAKADNVFWQAGTATLGARSAFKGTILANTGITLATSATLDGAALTQSGGVTLNASTITNQASRSRVKGRLNRNSGHR